jgi:hypothetical protein
MKWPGEEQAWDILSKLDTNDIQTNASVNFNSENSAYELVCLGQDIYISIKDQTISSNTPLGRLLINELGHLSRLSILSYLVQAKNIPLMNRLVRPSDLPGGDIFSRGTHVLPLDKIAGHFDNCTETFLRDGERFGGSRLDYGDMSIMLLPFPRIPIVLIVWSGDDEFPPKSSLLLDSSCALQLSTDIIWSTAMMTVEMVLMKQM